MGIRKWEPPEEATFPGVVEGREVIPELLEHNLLDKFDEETAAQLAWSWQHGLFDVTIANGRVYFSMPHKIAKLFRQVSDEFKQHPGPCPCECNNGGFCGGCGHAGCGGRK